MTSRLRDVLICMMRAKPKPISCMDQGRESRGTGKLDQTVWFNILRPSPMKTATIAPPKFFNSVIYQILFPLAISNSRPANEMLSVNLVSLSSPRRPT